MGMMDTRRVTGALALLAALQSGCGDDGSKGRADAGEAGNAGDAGAIDEDSGSAEDAGPQAPIAVALDVTSNADAAAQALCKLMPWVVARLGGKELPAAKIKNLVREDRQTFIEDKPPICVDDADSTEDLCIEMPTEAETFAYLYRSPEAAASDPVEQVWCKSDSFGDLALIKGAESATRGECEALQRIVVAWAEAQLSEPSTRSIAYESNLLVTGSAWSTALVTTREQGAVLTVTGPELYAPTKAEYIEENGTVLSFLNDDFFGNHYCKVLSPARALAWLQGS